jgi:uncharacterized protein YbjT (DUF2867 family)
MNILVTGITGYIGSRLATRLAADDHSLRGFSRRATSLTLAGREVPVVSGDALTGAGLDEALADVEVAYYLMHSMEPSTNGTFGAHELLAAENFARAAHAAGTQRIVFLGGPAPGGTTVSPHLASRLAVERILLGAAPCSIALRASIVIGAGSRSFRLLVRLVERMPVLPLPAWHANRTNPIDERDIIEILARSATADGLCGRALDAAGPDEVSYGELVGRIGDLLLVGRPAFSFKRLAMTPIVSRVAAVISGEDHALIGPLMESLQTDLLPRQDDAGRILGVRMHSLDAAIEHALGEWEATEPLAAR